MYHDMAASGHRRHETSAGHPIWSEVPHLCYVLQRPDNRYRYQLTVSLSLSIPTSRNCWHYRYDVVVNIIVVISSDTSELLNCYRYRNRCFMVIFVVLIPTSGNIVIVIINSSDILCYRFLLHMMENRETDVGLRSEYRCWHRRLVPDFFMHRPADAGHHRTVIVIAIVIITLSLTWSVPTSRNCWTVIVIVINSD